MMIVLSLNLRGIGGILKSASFRNLLENTMPNVIFLQETLSTDQKARVFLHSFRPSWVSVAVSSLGHSGGMLVAWDPCFFDLSPYLTCGGLLLVGRCLATNQELAFINVYGPCISKLQFWSSLANSGILSIPNLILGGDLNITLSADEHWGGNPTPGPSNAFFRDLFSAFNLIDILPSRLLPTWRNGRSGNNAIARRLDRFLVSESFLSSPTVPSSWVVLPFFSDHAPIILKLNSRPRCITYPFKFNHHWLSSPDYTDLVQSVWTDPIFLNESDPQLRLIWKLKALKFHSKSWNKRKKVSETALLHSMNSEINNLIIRSASAQLSSEDSVTLKNLEQSRAHILREEEQRWRLKSRATWLNSGDSNTKYFHRVASHNRDKKLIWSIMNQHDE
jgi:exonuclease III